MKLTSPILALAIVASAASSIQAQSHGAGMQQTFALALLDDKGGLVVRDFYYGFPAAAPKKDAGSLTALQPKKPPIPSIQENRFVFNVKEVIVTGLDGKAIEAATWKKTFAKETAILFGFLIGPPNGDGKPKDQPAPVKPPVLPEHFRDVFKAETLIVYATGEPTEETSGALKGDGPKSQAPHVTLASLKDGMLTLQQKFQDDLAFPITVKEKDKDGKFRDVQITISESVRGTRTREIPVKYAKAFDAKGQELTAEKLPALLGQQKGVLESMSGGTVDPFYLRLVRPEAVLLAVPQPVVQYGPPIVEELPPKK